MRFSALSTTGYATCDYSTWGAGAIGVMILLMLIGGGAGSNGGRYQALPRVSGTAQLFLSGETAVYAGASDSKSLLRKAD